MTITVTCEIGKHTLCPGRASVGPPGHEADDTVACDCPCHKTPEKT